MSSRSRWLRGLRFVAWVAVATLVLVEAVMQAGAYAVHLARRADAAAVVPPAAGAPATDRILCVGDSWTHGLGASDHTRFSYPAVLQELLRERTGTAWTTQNGGRSGLNSRDVLLRLPSQLAESRPRLVCVLVGRNDSWSRPAEVVDEADRHHSTYRFRWRLPRLIAWATGSGDVPPHATAPRGPEWAPHTIPWPHAYPDEPWPWPLTVAGRAHKAQGWRLDGAGDARAALAAFEAAQGDGGDDPQTRQALVSLHLRLGRTAAAEPHLAWLAERWQQDRSYWVGKSLVSALDSAGRSGDALRVATEFLSRWPDEATVWGQRAHAEFQPGDHAAALASIDRCLADYRAAWAFGIRYKVQRSGLRNLPEALRSIYEGYVHTNDAAWAAGWLSDVLEDPKVDAQELQRALARIECAADVRQRLSTLVEEAERARDGAAARRVLRAHLHRIAALCRDAGAQPVFLNYPIRPPFEEVIEETARADGVPFVDVQQRFAAKLGGRSLQPLRSSDGHVDDDGYRILAECVADALLAMLAAGK